METNYIGELFPEAGALSDSRHQRGVTPQPGVLVGKSLPVFRFRV